MFGYIGGYFATIIEKNTDIVPIFNRILNVSVLLAISEFLFQYNFLDSMRNLYIGSDDIRFNTNLGMIRLGLKASMGQYASTLPFAYNTFIIYVFLRLEDSNSLSVFWRVLSFIAICFSLSRAVIILFIVFEALISLRSIKNLIVILLVGLSVSYMIKNNSNLNRYISDYIIGIYKDQGKDGFLARVLNNTGDLAVLNTWDFITGKGAGSLESMKRGIADGNKLNTSDSGI